jgi:hypothetical protein
LVELVVAGFLGQWAVRKNVLRVAAELTVAPSGRSVSDVLEAWVRKHDATWAPASRRDRLSRVARINGDRIA